ncbi:hypothetical protein [Chitinophaga pinensis]|uniref:Uncharacterized protein n=1 Tax=Chitinophaga pinensis (strain ATCC 43595 / DSM 2588 / LMG 13176 / NBRC 15968 / NCIMB 11800 / UQM 2034) TaxID=485918 RepID=A0A979GRS5_CHIPD|nr:hypothetical protein [Chitinophaga pinensis]ACU62557.1 hypothetical protein Cpin_5125 [Chitinophaga pinensis DSM 2588]
MDTIIIKRSTDPNIEASLGWLLVVVIPVILFSYALFTARHRHDAVVYGIIIIVFLLPSLVNFLATRIPLKASIIMSDRELLLSPGKSIYSSFAFWQKIRSGSEKRLLWGDITGFRLMTRDKEYIVSPTDGSGAATYTATRWYLHVDGKTKNDEFIFCIHGLEEAPDKILSLCNHFLKEYEGAGNR